MLPFVLVLGPILAATLAQQAPTPQDIGGAYGQPVICQIENVPKTNFTSLYDYANRNSKPESPKYERTAPVFAALTMAGHAAAVMGMSTGWIDLVNPFAWISAADYYDQGTGLTWTPKKMNGEPQGINFTVLGDQPAGVVRVQTCRLLNTANPAK